MKDLLLQNKIKKKSRECANQSGFFAILSEQKSIWKQLEQRMGIKLNVRSGALSQEGLLSAPLLYAKPPAQDEQ